MYRLSHTRDRFNRFSHERQGTSKLSQSQVDAERFISAVIREPSDYTRSRRLLFDDMSVDQVLEEAAEYEYKRPSEAPNPWQVRRNLIAYKTNYKGVGATFALHHPAIER